MPFSLGQLEAAINQAGRTAIEDLVSVFDRCGLDIHTRTAAIMYGCLSASVTPEQREAAKTANNKILYGAAIGQETTMTALFFAASDTLVEATCASIASDLDKVIGRKCTVNCYAGEAATFATYSIHRDDWNVNLIFDFDTGDRGGVTLPVGDFNAKFLEETGIDLDADHE